MELSNIGKYRKTQMLLKLTRKIKLNRNKSADFRKLNTLCLGKLSVMLRTKKKKKQSGSQWDFCYLFSLPPN